MSREIRVGDLVEKVQAYHPTADVEIIRRAYDFSAAVHKGQKRLSGEPYLIHPIAVAGIIADLKLDVPSIVSGLLHDTLEDTLTTFEQIKGNFGAQVAALVDGVTKLSRVNFTSHEQKQAENFRKMILAMAKDVRVILIKLADRTHNMRTLNHLPVEKQIATAEETLEIYAPLAHRLGIGWIKSELEDLTLKHLRPEIYYQLKRNVAQKKGTREKYSNEVISVISKKLAEEGIDAEVTGRPKHFYSIYRKMESQDLPFDQILDLVGFRIVVDSVRECYEVLGVVHAYWKPVPGRFKDYIALRKPNMYQSLHTTVIGPYGQRVEIQIRTHEMHRVSEEGIAAHWRYKEGKDFQFNEIQRFAWLRQLLEWEQNLEDPQEFLHSIKEDLFPDEVYGFTPKGDLWNFPKGATVIDFAYRIHTDIGHHCTGARVNGQLVPLRYIMRSGDTVEIITTHQQLPSRDWLKLVKTPRAKSRIRNWIKAQQKERSLALGREILEGDMSRHNLDYAELRRGGKIKAIAQELGAKDEEALLASVGYGRITPRQVLMKLLPPEKLDGGRKRTEGALGRLFRLVGRQKRDRGVKVKGAGDVLVRFARCCHPLPGEEIIGFITLGRGVTVHVSSCSAVLESDPHRKVEVNWEEEGQTPRSIKIEVSCIDRPGLLAAISSAITSAEVNIARAHVRTFRDQKATNTFEIMITNTDQLKRVLRSISKVKGVNKVIRARG
ncbi:MAG: bifunctional (p)ppGpp synthetase/guanosine-3',5'-bis(diphosphate) 3'-pyrophosphohydrolase [Deltaproteobacteria bacterium]|nr:bifunctional (p)ppGpp synthetase/guanosine-3',5'-bis(diphosphate) 3'-pyrophosphohydrolase [Deltaproteobacteria bacterium]MCZ6563281.1 bifunctional (p)ppGpp synthetase/guanosine-3',5'-bis(diphosphate) 3'-pyrophosphohydrolase [Deltaproteobacteria bacterium]MCZ6621244.1 bifunctional (p)ppGpp synthetase/guanosine-3',5'-bis(diphosphate) 3'-pyrophosphohydrolase [Deltaproteobacteria bacterium]